MTRLLFMLLLGVLWACSPPPAQEPLERPIAPPPLRAELPSRPSIAPLIVIDPGHGGHDEGAKCLSPAYPEKQAALQLGLLLQRQLTGLGYRVLLTRAQDLFLSLYARSELANRKGAEIFISLHFNYGSNPQAKGIEVFSYSKDPVSKRDLLSRRLGQQILRGAIETTQTRDRGVKEASFVVIRTTKMPSVLVEGGFLSNKEEGRAIGDRRYLEKLAHGIALGVHRYFLENPPAKGR